MNTPLTITVIGRGHSGTRAIAQALYASGVFMGNHLNRSCDLIPPDIMYNAVKTAGKYVEYKGNNRWDFTRLINDDIDKDFEPLLNEFLKDVLSTSSTRGWKLPETTLVYPWVIRLFPDIKYIRWVRDPRDNIANGHPTDRLKEWNIDCDEGTNIYEDRAISWIYQWELMEATPDPKHLIKIKFEDYILKHDEISEQLEDFLGIKLARLPMRKSSINKHKKNKELPELKFLDEYLYKLGYK